MFQHSCHSAMRASQRHLDPLAIEYVLEYGRRYHQAGALLYYLGQRDIPEPDQRYDMCSRLAGTAVVMSRDGRTVITVWRNRNIGRKRLQTKNK